MERMGKYGQGWRLSSRAGRAWFRIICRYLSDTVARRLRYSDIMGGADKKFLNYYCAQFYSESENLRVEIDCWE